MITHLYKSGKKFYAGCPSCRNPPIFIRAWDRHQETQKCATNGWVKDELQIEKIIEHPLFWNPKQKIKFFIEAHKFFKRKNISEEKINQSEMFNTNYFSQSTEGSIAPVISCDYGEVEIDGEWINIKDIEHHGKDFENMKTIQIYLKFFRDMWNHADEEKYSLRGKWLGYNYANGKLDQNIFWNHITQPCPQLLLSIYNEFYEQIKEFTTSSLNNQKILH